MWLTDRPDGQCSVVRLPLLHWLAELPQRFDDAIEWDPDPFLDWDDHAGAPADWSANEPWLGGRASQHVA